MKTIFAVIKSIVWGAPTIVLLSVAGIYFTLKTRFFRPAAIVKTAKDTVGSLVSPRDKGGVSPFAAVATALGGTVGVGSIIGVGYGIAVGGYGSVFWMWVCSFFGMGLKYAEVHIALNGRTRIGGALVGGAPFRLRSLGYKRLAVLFAVCCVAASFGTGNIVQVGTVSEFLSDEGVPTLACAVLCCVAVSLAVFGGRSRIATINALIVPVASAVYLSVCVAVIFMNISAIPSVFSVIFKEAFGISAVTGGFSGAVLAKVLREGFVRSMFSNEAGMGSSPLAHSASTETNPKTQAEWGIFEIFFDTFAVSTVTALCLIIYDTCDPFELFGNVIGHWGEWLLLVLSAVFAFASVISWCFYAECAIDYLFPNKKHAKTVYHTVFSLTAFAGAYISGSVLWDTADILNALMTFPNLFLLYKCRNEIERII